jgi:hypothetical protein
MNDAETKREDRIQKTSGKLTLPAGTVREPEGQAERKPQCHNRIDEDIAREGGDQRKREAKQDH